MGVQSGKSCCRGHYIGKMGTACRVLIVLCLQLTNFIEASNDSTTTNVATKFLTSLDDFVNHKPNKDYFPLTSALVLKKAMGAMPDQFLEKLVADTEDVMRGYRNYDCEDAQHPHPVPKVTAADIACFLPVSMSTVDIDDIVKKINERATNLAKIHRYSEWVKKSGSIADKDRFLSKIRVPEHVLPELEFIAGYRWNLGITDYLSAGALSRLPFDSVMNISTDVFNKEDFKLKLTEDEFMPSQRSLSAWFTLAEDNLGDELLDNFTDYYRLVLASPIVKMLDNMRFLNASYRMKLLQDFDLEPIRVQAIWDSIDNDAITVEDISEKDISSLFFSVGNKLDIKQVDMFYRETFAHLYSQRHEVEELWIHNDKVDIAWPVLKYIAKQHFPSNSPDKWRQKELIDIGAFGVALTRDQLKQIPASAFAVKTMKEFFSSRLSLGQLFVIFDKIEEGSVDSYKLPSYLYPCLHSSVLSGSELSQKMELDYKVEDMVKASKMFTPAQKMAYLQHLKPNMWNKETLAILLQYNPDLLASLSTQEFISNLSVVLEGVWYAGRSAFPEVLKGLQTLPRRMLHAWILATAVDETGNLNIDDLLNVSDETDLYTRLRASVNATSIALPGMNCDLIDNIPSWRLIEVLSVYRFSMPDEVIPSDARMCFVTAIRNYLKTKAEAFNLSAESDIELGLLSLLSSSDIRAIGAEVFLSWGGDVLYNIPHPEVSYEILLKIGEEQPHLFFHNGVTYDDIQKLAAQLYKILQAKNSGVVDISVMKKMGSLLPYLSTMPEFASQDLQMFFRSGYVSDLHKGVCMKSDDMARFSGLITKAFGSADTWTADVLTVLGDLLVTLPENQLYEVEPEALRQALPTLVKRSVYSNVKLPEVKGFLRPQLYYKACQLWLNDGKSTPNKFVSAWEKLAGWHMSGASLMTAYLADSPVPRDVRRKRQADSNEIPYLYEKVMEVLRSKVTEIDEELLSKVNYVFKSTEQQLVAATKKVLGLSADYEVSKEELKEIISTIRRNNDVVSKKLAMANNRIKLTVMKKLVNLLDLTATDLSISSDLHQALIDGLPFRYKEGNSLATDILNRHKRDVTDVNFMDLHDKVMELLIQRFGELTPEQQEESKHFITDSQERLGNATLILLGKDPTKLSLSQADVLTIIEEGKAQGMTDEQEQGIVKIARDAQVRLIQELSSLLNLTATDLGITEQNFDEIKSIVPFQEVEKYMVTAVYEFTTSVTEVTPVDTTFTINESIDTIVKSEETLIKSIFTEIPKVSDLQLTCDIIKTAGKSASMITRADIAKMSAQEIKDCMEVLGSFDYTEEKSDEIWGAMRSKLSSPFNEGEMVLLRNLLPAIAKKDLDRFTILPNHIDGLSVLGEVYTQSNDKINETAAKYIESKEGAPLTELEIKSLGKILCGMSEHQWNSIENEVLINALPQIVQAECKITQADVAVEMKIKLNEIVTKFNIFDLGWISSFTLPDVYSVDFRELPGSAVMNFGNLTAYPAEQLAHLNPQAASMLSVSAINELSDVDELSALARASGEDPKLRSLLTDKLVAELGQYPPPINKPSDDREGKGGHDAHHHHSASPALDVSLALIICSVVIWIVL